MSSSYNDFSHIYDKYWSTQYADQFFSSIFSRFFKGCISKNSNILDLCCGSGDIANILHQMGHTLTGIDLSDELINIAKNKYPGIQFIHDNAINFKPADTYDFIYSLNDSFNHLMSIESLEKVFTTAYLALKPGKKFLFDMNMACKYKTAWENTFNFIEDDIVAIFEGKVDFQKKIASLIGTCFSKSSKEWLRSDITLVQTWYTLENILSTLKRVGFSIDGVLDKEANVASENTKKIYFICTR